MLIYGEGATTFSTPVELIRYSIPAGKAFKLKSLIGWGDTPGEFEVYLNDEIKGGCRTSDEKRTEQIWWGESFICDELADLVVIGTHYSSGLRKLRCSLELTRI